jgi:hypothetical protein
MLSANFAVVIWVSVVAPSKAEFAKKRWGSNLPTVKSHLKRVDGDIQRRIVPSHFDLRLKFLLGGATVRRADANDGHDLSSSSVENFFCIVTDI